MFKSFFVDKKRVRLERIKDLLHLNFLQFLPFFSSNLPHKIFVNSIPKAGTNLLIKTLYRLPDVHGTTLSFHSEMYGTPWQPWRPLRQRIWQCFPSERASYNLARQAKIDEGTDNLPPGFVPIGGFHKIFLPQKSLSTLLSHVRPGSFFDGHIPYSATFEHFLAKENFKSIFIVRDPRDVMLSELHYFLRESSLALHPLYKTMGFEEGMLSIIRGFRNEQTDYPVQPSMREIILEYLPWMDKSYVLLTRFEDLVGPHGGGNLNSQVETILLIANHIGVSLAPEEARKIGATLFGGTHTFRRGKIGAWKKDFSAELKKQCKQYIGDLLIQLGYEKNLDW
ncbi:MAG: sulfotransferase domain-containing protein [Ardenticatenaceae bacterium]|nr:sulfotransferase domain-containing protein [Ardenticatenaceae bacterium]